MKRGVGWDPIQQAQAVESLDQAPVAVLGSPMSPVHGIKLVSFYLDAKHLNDNHGSSLKHQVLYCRLP